MRISAPCFKEMASKSKGIAVSCLYNHNLEMRYPHCPEISVLGLVSVTLALGGSYEGSSGTSKMEYRGRVERRGNLCVTTRCG